MTSSEHDSMAATGEPPRPRRGGWPNALVYALLGSLLASGVAWWGARAALPQRRHTLLVLGDSLFAGYRMDPRAGFQHWLQSDLGSSWGVINFAEPAAEPGDFYLRLNEAELLGVKPDVVVIGLAPQKLLADFNRHGRLNGDGNNLSWLPLDQEGYRFFQTLDPHMQRVALVRKLGLIFGFYEGLRALSLQYIEWPQARRRHEHTRYARHREWLHEQAESVEQLWAHAHYEGELERSPPLTSVAQDFIFLIEALRARHTQVVAVVPPEFHTGVMQTVSEPTLRNLDAAYQQTLQFCARLGVPVVDFNQPVERNRFLPEQWDDLNHLRAPECFRRMAHAVSQFLQLQGLTHA